MFERDDQKKSARNKRNRGGPKEPPSALERAVRLLASRRLTTAELRRKLKQRGYEEPEIDDAVAKMEEYRYLDDELAARDWASELARIGSIGKRRAEQKLVRRGIQPESAHEELEKVWDESLEKEHVRHLVSKKLRSNSDLLANRQGKAKLFRFLMNKGFSSDIIREVMAEKMDLDD